MLQLIMLQLNINKQLQSLQCPSKLMPCIDRISNHATGFGIENQHDFFVCWCNDVFGSIHMYSSKRTKNNNAHSNASFNWLFDSRTKKIDYNITVVFGLYNECHAAIGMN